MLRVSVSAMPAAPKVMMPLALRTNSFMRSTAVPLLRVMAEMPALSVVEPTTSVWLPPDRLSVPLVSVSPAPFASLLLSWVL